MNENLFFLNKKLKHLPESPGVYIMLNKNNKIIYIGKAKSLKHRVSNYFQKNKTHSHKIIEIVKNVYDLNYIITSNEYEALVLECNLIKIHKPKYNTLLKNSEGYYFIKIIEDEFSWPRFSIVHKKEDENKYVGPFLSYLSLKNMFYEILWIFKIATCKKRFYEPLEKFCYQRPCLDFYIDKCCGPCSGNIPKKEYKEKFDIALKIFCDPKNDVITMLKKQMLEAAKIKQFERAAVLRDNIKSLVKLKEKQKFFQTKIKNHDVIAFAKHDNRIQVVCFIFRNFNLQNTEKFCEKNNSEEKLDDFRAKFLLLYYQGKVDVPEIIIIDGKISYKEFIEKKLSLNFNKKIEISNPNDGDQLEIVNLCAKNAFHFLMEEDIVRSEIKIKNTALDENKKEFKKDTIIELRKILNIQKIPNYIESYDISNFAGKWNVGSMVVFENGIALKKNYRRFKIENFSNNDYGSLQEILERRFKRYLDCNNEKDIKISHFKKNTFSIMPDLILIDGSIGQVNSVIKVLSKFKIFVQVFGMVKDNKHKTRALCNSKEIIEIKHHKNVFDFIQKIQDETHRFAINYHRKLRNILY